MVTFSHPWELASTPPKTIDSPIDQKVDEAVKPGEAVDIPETGRAGEPRTESGVWKTPGARAG